MKRDGIFMRYVEKTFRADRLLTIERINKVTDEYSTRGFILTVRQVFYQFVSRGWIANTGKSYDYIQSAINDGRLAGLISWTAIEDRGRDLKGHKTYTSPQQLLQEAREDYKRDLWANQPMRPEVWVEKQALEGIVGRICSRLRVDFYATKGYDSQSQSWRAGRRFVSRLRRGQRPLVLHLADHDPSGIDMTRDNFERLQLFTGISVPVERLALNMDQVTKYNPPPNPAKMSDARAANYVLQWGDESWELDALDPQVISDLIENAVDKVRDPKLWEAALEEEVEDLRELDDMIASADPQGDE